MFLFIFLNFVNNNPHNFPFLFLRIDIVSILRSSTIYYIHPNNLNLSINMIKVTRNFIFSCKFKIIKHTYLIVSFHCRYMNYKYKQFVAVLKTFMKRTKYGLSYFNIITCTESSAHFTFQIHQNIIFLIQV